MAISFIEVDPGFTNFEASIGGSGPRATRTVPRGPAGDDALAGAGAVSWRAAGVGAQPSQNAATASAVMANGETRPRVTNRVPPHCNCRSGDERQSGGKCNPARSTTWRPSADRSDYRNTSARSQPTSQT